MEIGSNTLKENGELINLDYDDEQFDDSQEEPGYEDNGEDEINYQNDEPDVISQLLIDKGINPEGVKFVNDNNQIEEKHWNDLTAEEQYNILSQQETPPAPNVADQLSNEELQLLNYMRANNLTPSEFYELSVQNGIQNYIGSQGQPSYQVDEFSDDELYLADLQLRAPDATEEELLQSLESAKANPDMYQKQIQGLRKEYADLEEQNQQEEAALRNEQAQEQYRQFSETIFDSINSLSGIGGIDIELEDSDKQDIATLILGHDQAGVNYLQKALSDPNTLTSVAWFLLKGRDTIDGIINYFTKEISKVRENSFRRGQESFVDEEEPRMVITPHETFTQKPVKSIDELD